MDRVLGPGAKHTVSHSITPHVTRDSNASASPLVAPPTDQQRPDGVADGYRVYKRRWFGLLQLVLLNIIVSWDVSLLLSAVKPARPTRGHNTTVSTDANMA